MEYFIITTCITAAIGVLGMSLDPSAKFGYESFFSPLIFGLISLVPSLVTYSRKEISFWQVVIRKILYLILLEGLLIFFGFWSKILTSVIDSVFFGITVIIVYILVNIISWQIDRKEAVKINSVLKSFQGRE
ncbi:MAG: hypothetical protein AB9835_12175 [Eubacteriales bacterium]